jgi:hypothetical protein
MISEYMHNVPGGDLYSVDVPRHASVQLRTFLADRGYLVFMEPDRVTMGEFAWSELDPVFLFKRGETFASTRANGHRIASIDRIWVDMYFLRTRKGLAFPLTELGVVLRNLLSQGSISVSRMLRYSSRRGLRTEVQIILYELGKAEPSLRLVESIIPRGRNAEDWIQEVVSGSVEGW